MKRKTHRKKRTLKRSKRIVKKQGTKKATDRGLKKLNCSPKPKDEINSFTCYTDRSLFKMRDLWNARHPDAKIETNDTKEIHTSLSNYFRGVCNKESCWLTKIPGSSYRDMEETFAPESPAEWSTNPNEWLTSVDIMKVMKHYSESAFHEVLSFDILRQGKLHSTEMPQVYVIRVNNGQNGCPNLRNCAQIRA